jgi:hydroxycarboxylate dehydrogenase B
MLIKVDVLERLVRDIFRAEGCSEAESGRVALYLVRANLAGHDSHGVIRVPRYLSWLRSSEIEKNQTAQIVTENDSMAVVDGRFGLGQSIGPEAVQVGLRKVAGAGAAIVALRNSGHLGRIGEWAEMAAEAGIASVHFVNVAGSQLVAPFGGVDRRLSTAPFSVGFPVRGRDPIILDFATSAVAEGKVLVAARGGKKLPAASLIEPDGKLTADPHTLYGPYDENHAPDAKRGQGAIRAFGEHKGSGLAFMCELLAGALTGSGCAGPGDRRFANGMLSFYIRPSSFGSDEAYTAEAERYISYFKSSRPAIAGEEVLVPGEPERRTKADRIANGVPLPDDAWRAICDAARSAGVDPAAYPLIDEAA